MLNKPRSFAILAVILSSIVLSFHFANYKLYIVSTMDSPQLLPSTGYKMLSVHFDIAEC